MSQSTVYLEDILSSVNPNPWVDKVCALLVYLLHLSRPEILNSGRFQSLSTFMTVFQVLACILHSFFLSVSASSHSSWVCLLHGVVTWHLCRSPHGVQGASVSRLVSLCAAFQSHCEGLFWSGRGISRSSSPGWWAQANTGLGRHQSKSPLLSFSALDAVPLSFFVSPDSSGFPSQMLCDPGGNQAQGY